MRSIVAFLVAVLAFAAPASAKPSRVADLNSNDAVLRWIYAYGEHPDVSALPAAVRTLSAHGAFSDNEKAGVYIGFIAGVLGAHPSRAEELIAKMFPLPENDHWAIVRAIAWSGHSDWKRLLQRNAGRMPTRRVMIEKLLAGKLPTLDQLVIEASPTFRERMRGYLDVKSYFRGKQPKAVKLDPSPDLLDTLWGHYFATRTYEPLARILAMLPWSKDRDSAEKLVLGSMAKYTLASNAMRDPALLVMLKWSRARLDKVTGPIVDEVIEAADTTDTARIRKDALAAVEELKRKGPGFQRDVAWWGKIGQGALALGCIGAASAGMVALGLPCVIGGATSSAVLNAWGTPQ